MVVQELLDKLNALTDEQKLLPVHVRMDYVGENSGIDEPVAIVKVTEWREPERGYVETGKYQVSLYPKDGDWS